jgi:hypothetical protein
MFRKEECALDMGQRSKYAAVRDALRKSSEEECAGGMGQRLSPNYAARRMYKYCQARMSVH